MVEHFRGFFVGDQKVVAGAVRNGSFLNVGVVAIDPGVPLSDFFDENRILPQDPIGLSSTLPAACLCRETILTASHSTVTDWTSGN